MNQRHSLTRRTIRQKYIMFFRPVQQEVGHAEGARDIVELITKSRILPVKRPQRRGRSNIERFWCHDDPGRVDFLATRLNP